MVERAKSGADGELPGSGVRTVRVDRVLREALELVATPAVAEELLARALVDARLEGVPDTAGELAELTSGALSRVVLRALGEEALAEVARHVSLMVHALRKQEEAQGRALPLSVPPPAMPLVAMVLGAGGADVRRAAPRGTTVLRDAEVEALHRALRLLLEQKGCVVVDARVEAPWEREHLRSDAFAALPVVTWGDAARAWDFEQRFTDVGSIARVDERADAEEVLRKAGELVMAGAAARRDRSAG